MFSDTHQWVEVWQVSKYVSGLTHTLLLLAEHEGSTLLTIKAALRHNPEPVPSPFHSVPIFLVVFVTLISPVIPT